eukprot:TRINITY_DN13433_c0_g6_i1.p1 TRINITY_DN13433_c0_g6~~TRINITY_DN13433_c0_g6_i1.p1  ORF type:complete len:674 (-),score=100.65 TRINITY_DN13433_c0_g6_i1:188-2209(-)
MATKAIQHQLMNRRATRVTKLAGTTSVNAVASCSSRAFRVDRRRSGVGLVPQRCRGRSDAGAFGLRVVHAASSPAATAEAAAAGLAAIRTYTFCRGSGTGTVTAFAGTSVALACAAAAALLASAGPGGLPRRRRRSANVVSCIGQIGGSGVDDYDDESYAQYAPAGIRDVDGDRVFVWGRRASLPLCEAGGDLVADGDRNQPVEVVWFHEEAKRRGRRWRQLSFGPNFGVARTDAGDLYIWGSIRQKGARSFVEPRLLAFDSAEGVGSDATGFRDVQCSESTVWAVTADGSVVVWENVSDILAITEAASSSTDSSSRVAGGRRLQGMSQPVRQMSVGATHAAFLTQDGAVYCLGSNHHGECGVDPVKMPVATTCQRVRLPRHTTPAVMVACGRSHTTVVGAQGQTLAFGDDSKIQLGLGDTRSSVGDERPWSGSRGYINSRQTGEPMAAPSAMRYGPDSGSSGRFPSTSAKKYGEFEAHFQWKPTMMIDIPLEFERQVFGIPYPPPDALVCGDDFTILVVRDSPDWFSPEEETNRLFCCGENGKGQCGRSLQSTQQIFAAARIPKCTRTLGTSCGSEHCLSVLTRTDSKKAGKLELWAWGSNDFGQAGAAKLARVCPAVRLRLPKEVQPGAVCCGFANSAVICNSRVSRKNSVQGRSSTAAAASPAAATQPNP